jgi:hypothetical protein
MREIQRSPARFTTVSGKVHHGVKVAAFVRASREQPAAHSSYFLLTILQNSTPDDPAVRVNPFAHPSPIASVCLRLEVSSFIQTQGNE